MISIHCNSAIALPLLPKLKSPFVLLPAATPWKKKSGMLWCTPASGIVFMSVQNDLALAALLLGLCCVTSILEFESSQVTEKKRTVYQMALSKDAHVCQWMFPESLPFFLSHFHQVCSFPHIVLFILLLSIFLFHCLCPFLFLSSCLSLLFYSLR